MVPKRGTDYQMEKIQLCISKLYYTAYCKQLRHYFVTFTKLNILLLLTRSMKFSVQTLFHREEKRVMKHVTTIVWIHCHLVAELSMCIFSKQSAAIFIHSSYSFYLIIIH